jgi:hypothetical protein
MKSHQGLVSILLFLAWFHAKSASWMIMTSLGKYLIYENLEIQRQSVILYDVHNGSILTGFNLYLLKNQDQILIDMACQARVEFKCPM